MDERVLKRSPMKVFYPYVARRRNIIFRGVSSIKSYEAEVMSSTKLSREDIRCLTASNFANCPAKWRLNPRAVGESISWLENAPSKSPRTRLTSVVGFNVSTSWYGVIPGSGNRIAVCGGQGRAKTGVVDERKGIGERATMISAPRKLSSAHRVVMDMRFRVAFARFGFDRIIA